MKTETMVVEMLHMVFTKRNFRIIIAAPFENQVRNMFMRLNELIKESPLVSQEVIRATKNPYIIEFANGSSILGFTTGDDAASIRGQRADFQDMYQVYYLTYRDTIDKRCLQWNKTNYIEIKNGLQVSLRNLKLLPKLLMEQAILELA